MPPLPSGTPPSRTNLRCISCGYGALVRAAPERCPMCGGGAWEHAGPDLLARLLQARVRGEPPDLHALFRRLNEDLAAAADGDELELVCECGDGRCLTAVGVTRAEFAALQGTAGHHLVAPGHAPGGRVTAAGRRFAVVALAAETPRVGAGRARAGRQ